MRAELIPPLLGYYTMGDAAPTSTVVVHDTFTDTDGTALNLHAPDINIAGNPWVVTTTVIASNKADGTATYNNARILTTLSDCKVTFSCVSASTQDVIARDTGILLRVNAADKNWLITINKTGDTFKITERNASTYTTRASASVAIDTETRTIVVTANGETISATLDGANDITYGSASAYLTDKSHGIILFENSVGDNFKVETI